MGKKKSSLKYLVLGVALMILIGAVILSDSDNDWKRLEYGEVSFKVPGSWRVIENATINGVCLGGRSESFVALESVPNQEEVHLCLMSAVSGSPHLSFSVRPHSGIVDETYKTLRVGQFDGVWKDSGTDTRIQNVVVVPQLKVEFEFDGDRELEDVRHKILDSVRLKG